MLMANIALLQFWARIGCPLRLVVSETTAFKFLDPLSGIATDPSGARRRAGVSGDRAIAIAVRDVRRGRRGAIDAENRDIWPRSRALDGGRLPCVVLAELQIVLSAFSIFTEPELLARPRARLRENQRRSTRFNASSIVSAEIRKNTRAPR